MGRSRKDEAVAEQLRRRRKDEAPRRNISRCRSVPPSPSTAVLRRLLAVAIAVVFAGFDPVEASFVLKVVAEVTRGSSKASGTLL
uniref:Uncharacterized protein n=1 Tax=Oryza brachyantha TaxID=4533 RepID=J3N7I4_ORYBR